MTPPKAGAAEEIGPSALSVAVLRIRDVRDEPVGVGFLVDTDLALTCAHVVTAALGTPDGIEPAAQARISVDLPLLPVSGGPTVVRACVEYWGPSDPCGVRDVAVLRLTAPPCGARPIRLIEAPEVWGHSARVYGVPAGRPGGVWHSGILRASQGDGWIQADREGGSYPVSAGFSGSPVWDDELGGVVGMIVAAESGKTPASYLIPTRDLTAAWPRLGEMATSPMLFPSRPRPRRLRRRVVIVAAASTAVVVAGTAVLVSSMNGQRHPAAYPASLPAMTPSYTAPPTPTPTVPTPTPTTTQPPITPTPTPTTTQPPITPAPTPAPGPPLANPVGAPPQPVTGINSAWIYPGYTQTVTVRWNPQPDATSFDIHYTTTGSSQHESVDTITNTTGTSYEFTAYQGETSCMYLRARNQYGVSAWSTEGTQCFTL